MSDGEPPGEGKVASFRLILIPAEEGEETKFWSDRAVVGLALFVDDPEETLPNGAIRPPENLDVVERREAREPGRKGDCGLLTWGELISLGS